MQNLKRTLSQLKITLQKDIAVNIVVICCVVFIAGSCLAISLFYQKNILLWDLICIISALFCAILLIFLNKGRFFSYFGKILTALFLGALFSAAYLINHSNHQKINGKLFAVLEGEISGYQKTKNGGQLLLIKDLQISKRPYISKKRKPKKLRRVTQSYIAKNYQNVSDFSRIDEDFLEDKKQYANPIWKEEGGKMVFQNPPKSVKIFVRKSSVKESADDKSKSKIKIGDVVKVDVMLEPHKKKTYIKGFDYSFYLDSKSVANSGYALNKPEILERSNFSGSRVFFGNLRKAISAKIYQSDVSEENKAAINALLTGDKRGIDRKYYKAVKDSGLAHLFSISGLHLSLAAGIFFVMFRFVLTRFEWVMLNFDAKKISAVLSIFSAYIYLNIADLPISAIRAFIAISFFMSAILIDRKISSLRMVLFAATMVVVINPFYAFFVAYQLSFSSILAIIYASSLLKKVTEDGKFATLIYKNKKLKLVRYFFEIILMSLAAQTATTPFLIYHFGNFPIYGILSNIVAIPIVSLITMPLGVLSLFLMMLNLHDLSLSIMAHSIDAIFYTAKFVAQIKFSSLASNPISPLALSFIILSFFVLILTSSRILKAAMVFLLFFLTFFGEQNPQPNILIGATGSYFALNDDNRGLVFSKKSRKFRQIENWMKNLNEKRFQYFDSAVSKQEGAQNYPDSVRYSKIMCEVDLGQYFSSPKFKKQKMLVLYKRVKLSEICSQNYRIVVNLTKKYELPHCLLQDENMLVIDSFDLLQKGGHFIYLEKNGEVRVKTVSD